MIFVLLLQGVLGFAIIGEFATEEDCKKGAAQYVEVWKSEHSPEAEFKSKLLCIGFPNEVLPTPREMSDT